MVCANDNNNGNGIANANGGVAIENEVEIECYDTLVQVLRQHGGQYIGYFAEDTIYGDGLLLLAMCSMMQIITHDTTLFLLKIAAVVAIGVHWKLWGDIERIFCYYCCY